MAIISTLRNKMGKFLVFVVGFSIAAFVLGDILGPNNQAFNSQNNIIFLDPPYYLKNKSKLYGNNGDMHETFDHEKLFEIISKRKNWIMTYNNCDYIKNLYKKFKIIETSWTYGMNKTKKSSEILIFNFEC